MSVKKYKILCVIFIWLFGDSNEFMDREDRPRNIGAPCEWEGVSGNCINYWTCVTNAIDATHGKHPPVCSFEGNEILSCCTSCYIVANISSTVIIEGFAFEKNGKKSHDINRLSTIGDTVVTPSARVFHVSLPAFGIAIIPNKVSEYLTSAYPHEVIILNNISVFLTILDKEFIDECLDYLKVYGRFYNCYGKTFGIGDFVKVFDKENNCIGYGQKGSLGVGGEDARRAEYPHMALLGYGEDRESAQWLCGGSLISERFILTAAHCGSSQVGLAKKRAQGSIDPRQQTPENRDVPRKAGHLATLSNEYRIDEVQFVALGILKRSDPPSLWQVYRVDTFIPHPEYKPPCKYHDIALIRTTKRVEFSNAVLPACLPKGDENEEDMQTAYATGWGTLGYRRRLADVLQKVKVTRFKSEQCSEQYGPHRHLRHGYHNTTQMCYGDSDVARDTCEGDSGGPLQIDEQRICPQVIIGVTSSGHPCGFAGTAGLYTRVTYYQPWIEGIVWP